MMFTKLFHIHVHLHSSYTYNKQRCYPYFKLGSLKLGKTKLAKVTSSEPNLTSNKLFLE